MRVKTKAYMAGIVDAEGCLYISKQEECASPGSFNYGITISVTNNSLRLIKWIISNFGGSYVRCNDGYRWHIFNHKHISSFLDLIDRYLIIKASQADILRAYISLNRRQVPEIREYLYQEIKETRSQECVTTNSSSVASVKALKPYLAGLLDGEGSIILGRQKRGTYYTRVSFENSFPHALKLFKDMYGGIIKPSHKVNLQCYKWFIDRRENKEKLLLQLIPYLIVKREKANLVLKFLRLGRVECPELRHELFNRSEAMKIESDLIGDYERAPMVT